MIEVILRWNGYKYVIIIDDYLPCVDNHPIYAKAKSGALWCSIVEKALAKLFDGYEFMNEEEFAEGYNRLTAGELMNNLLPMPTQEYDLNTETDLTSIFLD